MSWRFARPAKRFATPGGFRVLFQNSAVQAFDFVPADMVSASP